MLFNDSGKRRCVMNRVKKETKEKGTNAFHSKINREAESDGASVYFVINSTHSRNTLTAPRTEK